ncbi:hypothetical protein EDC01DRAFT_630727 [Geopyxis carbonaria]|nr:hypothetical protein EDC01DRAFT_630727 [Geopyxis carbonaria]
MACVRGEARCQERLDIQARNETIATTQPQLDRDAKLSKKERSLARGWKAKFMDLEKREKVIAAAEARLTAHAKKWANTRSFQLEALEGLRPDAKQNKRERDLIAVVEARLAEWEKKLTATDPDVPDEIGSRDDSGRDSVDRFFLKGTERGSYMNCGCEIQYLSGIMIMNLVKISGEK